MVQRLHRTSPFTDAAAPSEMDERRITLLGTEGLPPHRQVVQTVWKLLERASIHPEEQGTDQEDKLVRLPSGDLHQSEGQGTQLNNSKYNATKSHSKYKCNPKAK